MKNTNEEKQCKKCEETKPVAEFYTDERMTGGFRAECKKCHNARTYIHGKNRTPFAQKCYNAKNRANLNARRYGVESTLTLAEVRVILSVEHCAYCHEKPEPSKKTIDHVHPMEDGGANTFENVVMACLPCNNAKHKKPPYDFIMKMANRDATRLLLATLSERQDVAPIQALRLLERQQTAYSERLFRAKHCGESAQ